MIKYYDRKSNKIKIEQVAGAKYLKWTYSSPIGMNLLELFLKKKLFSKLYGFYCDSIFSKHKIKSFIDEFNIDISMCHKKINDFTCFNDFFTRTIEFSSKFKSEKATNLLSPCDGKILAYENIDLDNIVQVKNISYSFKELINDPQLYNKFKNGTCMILRLCPTDYHRFHFIDNGICHKTTKVSGDYYSVNPIALETIPRLFCKNKREYSLFNSENFGDILYVEVGATCVGSIIQTYTPNKTVQRGSEKGYFKFGGSTVVVFFENNKVNIDKDIINQSKLGIETQVFLGDKLGDKL